MSEALIGGICSIISAIGGIIVGDLLAKKKEKDRIIRLEQQKEEIQTLQLKLEQVDKLLPRNFEIIGNVDDVLQKWILPLVQEKSKKGQKVEIKNFGLDLHSVIPWIENQIIHSPQFDDTRIAITSLIIDPDSQHNSPLIDGESNVSSHIVKSSISIANDFNKRDDIDRFTLQIRQYELPPIFHGFLVNKEHLFLGFTELPKGKIVGGTKPYLHLWKHSEGDSEVNIHYFNVFENWFDRYWQISKLVASVQK